MIDENFRIKLEFTIEEMNLIFGFMESIPYGQVAGLYENVKNQVDAQLPSPSEIEEQQSVNTDYPV